MKNDAKKIAVYGSGVSGLIVSYYLLKKGALVDVIDPYEERTVGSLQTQYGVVEKAANSILANGSLIEMLQDIGLDYEYYFSAGKKKYVYLNGSAKKWPLTFKETLKNFRSLFYFVRRKEKMKPQPYETVEKWGARVLSPVVVDSLICPALQGVYGAGSKDISAKLAFSHFFEAKSIDKNKKISGSVSFSKGMGEFQDGLIKHLKKNGVCFLKENNREKNYDFSVVSTPAHSLPSCVSDENKEKLSKIKYKKVSTLTLFIDNSDRMDFSGFGCVFKAEPSGVLGLILNSDLFDGRASEGLCSETWILNGEVAFDEERSLKAVRKIRESFFEKDNKIISSYYKYWEKAFPNYSVELEHILNDLEPQEGVDFFANWTGSLGIGSMIKNGENFAQDLLKKMDGQRNE